jgi:hypothetical protein
MHDTIEVFSETPIHAAPLVALIQTPYRFRSKRQFWSYVCLDPGYPLPGKIRQAQFVLPQGTQFEGLKQHADLEVKGMRYPVR